MSYLREVKIPTFGDFLTESNAKERAILTGSAALIAPSDAMARSTDRGRKHANASGAALNPVEGGIPLQEEEKEEEVDYKRSPNPGSEGLEDVTDEDEELEIPDTPEDADPNSYVGSSRFRETKPLSSAE